MSRNPDIEKFCKNCGVKIERKRIGKRIEDYAKYRARKYCTETCYDEMRRKESTAVLPPPEPTKSQMAEKFASDLAEAQLIENLTPLEFMIREMNRKTNTLAYRKEMAALAAPYVHPKLDAKAPAKTKKGERADAAKGVATGNRFAPTAQPKVIGRIG